MPRDLQLSKLTPLLGEIRAAPVLDVAFAFAANDLLSGTLDRTTGVGGDATETQLAALTVNLAGVWRVRYVLSAPVAAGGRRWSCRLRDGAANVIWQMPLVSAQGQTVLLDLPPTYLLNNWTLILTNIDALVNLDRHIASIDAFLLLH